MIIFISAMLVFITALGSLYSYFTCNIRAQKYFTIAWALAFVTAMLSIALI